jgi:hypothetical protein
MTLVLTISFAPILPGMVRPAHAQVPIPTFETNPAVVVGITTIAGGTTATAATSGTQLFIKQVLDGLAWAVAKTAIQSMTKSMVNWINSGFNGSPAFVTDLNNSLLNLSDAVADDFFGALQKNTGVDVRSPFQDQIAQALRNDYYSSTGNNSYFRSTYNLNKYSSDPRAFVNGNFQKGSFDAWFQVLGNDQNNPLGAYKAGQKELNGRVQNAIANHKQELNWGRGFISWRGKCLAQKPPGGGTSLSSKDTCANYEIKTPGSVVETSLGITVNSPLRQLELANSINEIVGALAQQLVGQVLGGTGLSGLTSASSGGGRSFIDQASDPSQYSQQGASAATSFTGQLANDLHNVQNYQANWQKIQNLTASASQCSTLSPADSQTVQGATTRATAAIAKATQALTSLNAINTKVETAGSSNNSTTVLSEASTDYQNMLGSGTLPSGQDIADAQAQSSPAESGSTSLYTTLTKIASACGVVPH